MKSYNYLKAVTADVIDFIRKEVNASDYKNREALSEFLNDELWTCDSVTGNASGSYTFNAYKAKEFVFADTDTVSEAIREFCVDAETIAEKFISNNWEYFDVIARCYVLDQAIEAALYSLESELSFSDENKLAEGLIMNKSIKHPCIGCIYFKVCGETTRTTPCKGRKTKSEKKREEKNENGRR